MRTKPITIKWAGENQFDISDEYYQRDYHLRKEPQTRSQPERWYLDIFDSTKPTPTAHIETKDFGSMEAAIDYVTTYPLVDS